MGRSWFRYRPNYRTTVLFSVASSLPKCAFPRRHIVHQYSTRRAMSPAIRLYCFMDLSAQNALLTEPAHRNDATTSSTPDIPLIA